MSGRPDAPSDRNPGHRRAAGIYGTIITAAVLASAGGRLATAALAVAVLVTLLVYWAAEQYAQQLGEQTVHGQLPTWPTVRAGLASTWPMVSASYIPVLALVVSTLLGATPTTAANIGLSVAVVLLLIHGWAAGKAAELHGRALVLVTVIAGSLGVVMIVLKNAVVANLH